VKPPLIMPALGVAGLVIFNVGLTWGHMVRDDDY
jgi:hypothetical protein